MMSCNKRRPSSHHLFPFLATTADFPAVSYSGRASDSLRILVAQAGSTLSLVLCLILFKMALYNLLATGGASQNVSQSTEVSHTPLSLLLLRDQEDKTELQQSLDLLVSSQACADLLACLNYGLEVRVESAEDYARCKRSYAGCRGQGLLPHLNRLLRAVDERE